MLLNSNMQTKSDVLIKDRKMHASQMTAQSNSHVLFLVPQNIFMSLLTIV